MSILDRFSLQGKVALVTGIERGLGYGMATALAEAGADIAGIGISSSDNAEATVTGLGRRFHYQQVDLITAKQSEIVAAVDAVTESLGRVDILVNNAGIIRRTPVLDFTEADWDDVLQINLRAVFFLSQAVARAMKAKGGGKIVNVASMLSYQGGITVPSYTASKHGVMGITRALANELAGIGINVNAIAPGYMATDNTAALRADEKRNAAILERIPAGRWGTPEDLQGVVVFLASAASDYLNGSTIPVDGGWLAR